MRLKAYGKASQYSTIKNDDDDEVALRSGSEPSPSAPREIYLGQQRHYRQPSSNDIRVETNIEIRRGDRREMERDFP